MEFLRYFILHNICDVLQFVFALFVCCNVVVIALKKVASVSENVCKQNRTIPSSTGRKDQALISTHFPPV